MGIAASLISEFTQAAQSENISFLLADTPADNLPALHMFEKAGLTYKTDHVYLTRQLGNVDTRHVDEEDMTFSFSYTAKKKKITIRNMEIDDLHSVHAVGEKVFTDRHANLYNFWDEGMVLQSYLSDPELCAVATCKEKEEDKVVGFAFGTTIEKPRSSWKYGYLVWLGCAHEYQGIVRIYTACDRYALSPNLSLTRCACSLLGTGVAALQCYVGAFRFGESANGYD
jgi:ribosomal protein S18 acetylase RimI-like enzyme